MLAMLRVRNVVIEGIVLRDVPEFVFCFFPRALLVLSYSHYLSEYKKRPLIPLLTGFVRVILGVGYLVVVLGLQTVDFPGNAGNLRSCLCNLSLWIFCVAFSSYANTKYMQGKQIAQLHQNNNCDFSVRKRR